MICNFNYLTKFLFLYMLTLTDFLYKNFSYKKLIQKLRILPESVVASLYKSQTSMSSLSSKTFKHY